MRGPITTGGILEEIVGDIRDEREEEPEAAIGELRDGAYTIDGSVPIRDANETLASDFASEDFDTIGGLVLRRLGRTPEVGDEVRMDDKVFRAEEVDGPRVARVAVQRNGEEDAPTPLQSPRR